jgi:hypothetical protein
MLKPRDMTKTALKLPWTAVRRPSESAILISRVRAKNCPRRAGFALVISARMESHEVMRDVLKRVPAKRIASELGLSLSLIYKWAEPPEGGVGSGANNPLDRLGQLLSVTQDPSLAKWVCERAGGFFIRNPKTVKPHETLIPLTNDIVQEFADMLATIAQSAEDNVITAEEAKRIRARWEELKSVTEGFVKAAEEGSFRTKAS